jgi:mRNA-degrading endonuclease RelE of RelBE toxin-antitoxin system
MKLVFTKEAKKNFDNLKNDPSKIRILKDVVKTINLMEANLRHPSLNTHEYKSFKGPQGEKLFEAYAQQKTSGAYRIFWYYGPNTNTVTIVAILPHPK